jgi:hypothetical protein
MLFMKEEKGYPYPIWRYRQVAMNVTNEPSSRFVQARPGRDHRVAERDDEIEKMHWSVVNVAMPGHANDPAPVP